MKIEGPTPSRFSWHELGTNDDARATAFYSELFGWTIEPSELMDGSGPPPADHPDPEGAAGMTYWMIRQDGNDLAGAYNLPPAVLEAGVPPHWLSYVGVEDTDATCARASELGGTVAMGPMDVFDIGRMAVITDPTGATFALWQAKKHQGHQVCSESGAVCWNELLTHDPAKASDFYAGLFGWTPVKQPMEGFEYTMMMSGEAPVCGLMSMPPEAGEAPPNWMVYFQVDDTDEQVARATELGANVCGPIQDVPGVGRMAVLADPTGAVFAIIRLSDEYEATPR